RVLLHEALDVGLDHLGLERPAGEPDGGLGGGGRPRAPERRETEAGGAGDRRCEEASAWERHRGSFPFRRRQPLTAPDTSPWTISRWKRNASTRGGRTASTPPAAISVRSVVTSVAKPATTTGAVLAAMLDVRITANR